MQQRNIMLVCNSTGGIQHGITIVAADGGRFRPTAHDLANLLRAMRLTPWMRNIKNLPKLRLKMYSCGHESKPFGLHTFLALIAICAVKEAKAWL